MTKTAVFVGTSLDGFIARPNGDLDWLTGSGGSTGEDYGYKAFIEQIDAIVMGRGTFEKGLTFDAWPYEIPVFVLSHRPVQIPAELRDRVESMSGTPAEIIAALETRGLRRLYIDGGVTVQGFLRAGLIDEITISQLPVLIGQGIPLFGPTGRDVWLRHVETKTFAGGMVQSTYRVEGPGVAPEPSQGTRTGPS